MITPLPFCFLLLCPFCSDFDAQSTASGQHVPVELSPIVCGRAECQGRQAELDADIQRRHEEWKRVDGCQVWWCE